MKEEKKKAAGPLKTMSWITYPVDLDRQRGTQLSARDVVMTMGLPETKAYLNAPNADAVGIA